MLAAVVLCRKLGTVPHTRKTPMVSRYSIHMAFQPSRKGESGKKLGELGMKAGCCVRKDQSKVLARSCGCFQAWLMEGHRSKNMQEHHHTVWKVALDFFY